MKVMKVMKDMKVMKNLSLKMDQVNLHLSIVPFAIVSLPKNTNYSNTLLRVGTKLNLLKKPKSVFPVIFVARIFQQNSIKEDILLQFMKKQVHFWKKPNLNPYQDPYKIQANLMHQ